MDQVIKRSKDYDITSQVELSEFVGRDMTPYSDGEEWTLSQWLNSCDLLTYPTEYTKDMNAIRRSPIAVAREKMNSKDFCSFSISAVLSNRDANIPLSKSIISYNGLQTLILPLVLSDGPIDREEDERLRRIKRDLISIPYIYAVLLDYSGRCIIAIAATDNRDYNRHGEYFDAVSADLTKRTGFLANKKYRDIKKTCPKTYDGDILTNTQNFQPFSLPSISQDGNVPESQAKEKKVIIEADPEKNPGLPTDGLPGFFRNIALRYAEMYQCPVEHFLAPMFVAVGTMVGKKAHVFDGRYKNYPMLWMCIVGRPGANKSTPINEIFKPIQAINEMLMSKYQAAIMEYRAGNQDGPEPAPDRLVACDITPEQRNYLLSVCHSGFCMVVDEFGELLQGMTRYRASNEVAVYNKIYFSVPFPVDRRGSPSYLVKDPFMPMISTTQPAQLSNIFASRDFAGAGFIPRVQWILSDMEIIPYYFRTDSTALQKLQQAWSDAINYFYYLDTFGDITLSNEAFSLYGEFYNRHVDRMNIDRNTTDCEVMGKTNVAALRLALIIHFMKEYQAHIDGDMPGSRIIDGDTMAYAVECMEYFDKTGAKVMEMSGTVSNGCAPNLAELIRQAHRLKPDTPQSLLAEAFGVTPSFVSQAIHHKK